MRGDPSATETSRPPSFGRLLRRLRRERELTQGELARRVGLSHGAIGSYEAGHCHPTPQRLPELARALEVSEEELARPLPKRAEASPFGRALREWREQRGWTQGQLAARVGCRSRVISDYEVAGKQPGPKNLGALAAALGVPQRQLRALLKERSPKRQRTPFGRLLREARTARGLTQQQLAQAVGCPAHSIIGYETRNIYPREKRLSALIEGLAKTLDLSPAEIEKSLSQPRRPDIPTDFGHRLRQLRVDRGLTQKQLSALCGSQHAGISGYETGKLYPKPDFLPVLARALDIETSELASLVPLRPTRTASTPFGTELRRLRTQRGWTQGELGRRAGVNPDAISYYEVSSKRPNPHALAAIARTLGVPLEHFERLLPSRSNVTPFGRELRRLREQRGLTLQQLADRSACQRRAILSYELGRTHPPQPPIAAALARALGVPREQLERLVPPPPPPPPTPFARELRQLREQRGLTQQELATRIGRLRESISSYECGQVAPGPDVVSALTRALGVPSERLARLSLSRPETTPLGRELRRLRKERGLNQRLLATRLGCSQSLIWFYESGRVSPGEAKLAALARALGVPQQQLQLQLELTPAAGGCPSRPPGLDPENGGGPATAGTQGRPSRRRPTRQPQGWDHPSEHSVGSSHRK